jgi:DNA polymerase-3 subunit alpha (Gram-positive type)
MLTDYTVVDIETTGLAKDYHKITEIAAIKVKNNQIKDKFEELVNPRTRIPSFITNLTGISNEMVENKPDIKVILPQFLEFLEDDVMIAHNATFDHGFLSANAKYHLQKDFLNDKLCTRKLAFRLLNDLPSRKLACLCNHFHIENEKAHRAMSDVKATYQVFNNFNEMLEEKGITTKQEILKFQTMSLRKIKERKLQK